MLLLKKIKSNQRNYDRNGRTARDLLATRQILVQETQLRVLLPFQPVMLYN